MLSCCDSGIPAKRASARNLLGCVTTKKDVAVVTSVTQDAWRIRLAGIVRQGNVLTLRPAKPDAATNGTLGWGRFWLGHMSIQMEQSTWRVVPFPPRGGFSLGDVSRFGANPALVFLGDLKVLEDVLRGAVRV
jgi:hypothetical protein